MTKRKHFYPFKTDNPKHIGRLKTLEKQFLAVYNSDTALADAIWEEALSYHRKMTDCIYLCGQTNVGHRDSCLFRPRDSVTLVDVVSMIHELTRWYKGFTAGFNGRPFRKTFSSLGYERGQSEKRRDLFERSYRAGYDLIPWEIGMNPEAYFRGKEDREKEEKCVS